MSIAINKQAKRDYEIGDEYEAGLKLTGAEVKSAKMGRVDLKGSYASVDKQEIWIKNLYIAPYTPAVQQQSSYEPRRARKLLLKKKEINSIKDALAIKGMSLVPLRIYNKKGLLKISIGLGKGKKKYDKRESIKKRDFERRKDRLIKTG